MVCVHLILLPYLLGGRLMAYGTIGAVGNPFFLCILRLPGIDSPLGSLVEDADIEQLPVFFAAKQILEHASTVL